MTCERRRRLPAPPDPERASLASIGLFLSLLLGACAPANTAPPPSVPPPTTDSRRPDLSAGSPILVRRGALWIPARVVGSGGPDRVIVQYEGYGPEWNEPVSLDRIKPRPAASLARDYRIGDRVLVLAASNRLLVAEVVQQIAADRWRVHYDGYGPEVAEDVGPDRLRRPHEGPSPLALGQIVGVRAGADVLPAKVVAIVAPERWIVRFSGLGPESDQEIGPDRVAAPPPSSTSDPAGMGPERFIDPASSPAEALGSPPSPPSSAARPIAPGDEVFVSHRGVYHIAIVVSVGTDGLIRVRYATAGSESSEESVPPARVRPAPPPPSAKAAPFSPAQKVFVEWHGMFVPARVIRDVGRGTYRVRFDGLGPDADEVVPARRLRAGP